MGYYTAIKRNGALARATPRTTLKPVCGGKAAGHRRSPIVRFLLHEMLRTGKATDSKWIRGCQGPGDGGEWGATADECGGVGFCLGVMKCT